MGVRIIPGPCIKAMALWKRMPAGFAPRHVRRADGIVRGNKIQISRQPAESRMQIAGVGAGAFAHPGHNCRLGGLLILSNLLRV
jgi:hypothetical protein